MRNALYLWFAQAWLLAVGPIVSGRAATVPKWDRWEGLLQSESAVSDPLNVELVVEFTHSSGTRIARGFWDGGRSWRVRFMADLEGTWQYKTRSVPPINGLDNQTGTFECIAGTAGNPLYRHGALRVSARGPYLEHADGTPFFWLGDTVWNGAILSRAGDWEEYLKDRSQKKFSVVQYNAVAPWRTAAADELGQVAFDGRENIRINPAYFQRLDQRIDAINRAGTVGAHVLIWSLTDKDPGKYLPEEDVIRLVRYQLARYGAHHLVWVLAGDNPYDARQADRWKRVGRAVFQDLPAAVVTTHPTGMNWPWEDWQNETWLNLLGYQSGHGDDAHTLRWIHSGPVRANYAKHPRQPIINLEPPYEAHLAYHSRQPHSAHHVRRAVYWSLLSAPTAGVTYGGHGMWSWQTEVGTPTDHAGTGVAQPWRIAKDLPGSADMRRVAEFFGRLPWWELRPANELLATQPGRDGPARFVSVARTGDRKHVVCYLPVRSTIELRESADQLQLTRREWFNVRDGQFHSAQSPDGRSFSPPDDGDWVLWLSQSP
jgi:hypothetical protein